MGELWVWSQSTLHRKFWSSLGNIIVSKHQPCKQVWKNKLQNPKVQTHSSKIINTIVSCPTESLQRHQPMWSWLLWWQHPLLDLPENLMIFILRTLFRMVYFCFHHRFLCKHKIYHEQFHLLMKIFLPWGKFFKCFKEIT